MRERERKKAMLASQRPALSHPALGGNAQFHLGGVSIEDVVWMIGDILHTMCGNGRVNG